jgi:hypothetical protein
VDDHLQQKLTKISKAMPPRTKGMVANFRLPRYNLVGRSDQILLHVRQKSSSCFKRSIIHFLLLLLLLFCIDTMENYSTQYVSSFGKNWPFFLALFLLFAKFSFRSAVRARLNPFLFFASLRILLAFAAWPFSLIFSGSCSLMSLYVCAPKRERERENSMILFHTKLLWLNPTPVT